MKKSQLVFTFIFIFSLMLSAQDKKAIVAEYQNDTKIIVSKDNKTHTEFIVNCISTDIELMNSEALKYENYFSFESTKTAGETDSYNIKLAFNHKAQPMEYYKILLSMGFTGVKIESKDYPLEHLLSLK